VKTSPRSISVLPTFRRPFVKRETSIPAARRAGALFLLPQCLDLSPPGRAAVLRLAALLLAGFSSRAALQAQILAPPDGVVTLAGAAGSAGSTEGTGSFGRFASPSDIAIDAAGTLYIADTSNNTVRKVTLITQDSIDPFMPVGVVTTLAGQAGISGHSDGSSSATFNHPAGVAVDSAGNVYVADTDNNEIRKVTMAGVVSTVAGQAGVNGSSDGTGTAASFNGPSGIVADAAGNLYVADTLNHTIRRVTSAGVVTTIAGGAGTSGFVDATGSAAKFHGPQGLALDASGNLFVADTNNNAIRKIVIATRVVTTVAGQAGIAGSTDGAVSQAQFHYPSGVAVDTSGNLYVADTDNHTLRVIAPWGVVSTLAGLAGSSGSADGVGTAVRFNFPTGVAMDSFGNVGIADTNNNTIRLAFLRAIPEITQQPQSQSVTAGENATFTVTATGGPTLTYSWQATTKNGDLTSTRTVGSGRTLILTNVLASDAGTYYVMVRNSSGTATSSTAALIVNAPSGGGGSSGGSSNSGGGGGGGAPSVWFYGLLSLLALARRAWRRKP
jgi:sugar lactone lactonase YvrE